MGEASSEVAISDTVVAHSHCYLPETLVQSTAAARFAPGLVIQRRQSRLHGIMHIALRRIGCVGISNVGELKSRFGMFIFAESFNR